MSQGSLIQRLRDEEAAARATCDGALADLVAEAAARLEFIGGALAELRRVCVGMDADQEGERPTEAEYQAAMARAAEATTRGH